MFSALSRYLTNYGVHEEAWPLQEQRILWLFKRKAHLFLDHVPTETDVFQWLALMQHHGAPTRLLDFTWSPHVAAFFALERATSNCVVWAVAVPKIWNAAFIFSDSKLGRVSESAKNLSLRRAENYKRRFLSNKVPFVVTDDPFVMNQRIIAQSGTFLIPGVLDQPVESILSGLGHEHGQPEAWVVAFVLNTKTLRDEAMQALYRMNVTNATLFPGLDGTARSLAYELEQQWVFDPKTFEARPGYERVFEELKTEGVPQQWDTSA
jgi:FRG domain